MTITFQKLSPESVRKNYLPYYRDDITCFLILKDQTPAGADPAGLYGLIDRGMDPLTKERQAEAFLTIFPDFRHRVLGKGFFLSLVDHAFASGFEKVYTWTRLTSWKKLLDRFEPLGIHRLETPPSWSLNPQGLDPKSLDSSDDDPTKVWFMKQKEKES